MLIFLLVVSYRIKFMDGFLSLTDHLLGNLNCYADEKKLNIFHSSFSLHILSLLTVVMPIFLQQV